MNVKVHSCQNQKTKMNKNHVRIMEFIWANFPGGCTANVIVHDCMGYIKPKASERQRVYRLLSKLTRHNFLIKTADGYYTPRHTGKNRRYYLHRVLKKHYQVHAKRRQVDYIEQKQVSDLILLQLKELCKAGYNINYTIPNSI